jgi:glycosyltransferase involved in cell wall biosynthesis
MHPGYTALQKEVVARSDYLIANAQSEIHRIYRYLDNSVPAAVVPSSADPQIYGRHRRPAFVERYGLEDFVLITGRIERRKNQLATIYALRGRPERTLVCIGKNIDAIYGMSVRAYAGGRVVFLPHVPQTELAAAYAAARVVALPSWDEVVSLTSLNGAISEAALVLSRNGYEHEYFGDMAEYCDPGNVDDIAAAIDRAWERYEARAADREQLAERVRREYNWDRSAELTEAAYYRVLADNPRGRLRVEGSRPAAAV